ncbi:hypothetical protein LSH36_2265g00001, partial [Paralvinella palmiformis]
MLSRKELFSIVTLCCFLGLLFWTYSSKVSEDGVEYIQQVFGNNLHNTPQPSQAYLHNTKKKNGSYSYKCNESSYEFERNENATIFKDRELWRKCGINGTSFSVEYPRFSTPVIHTKCSTVNALLISRKYIERQDKENFLVPNIVHYILFGNIKFTFLDYLSFKSSDKLIKPRYIFVHGDYNISEGHGVWWTRMLEDVANVYYVPSPKIEYI